ncbi:hypothetical protein PENTCL1PPCAC_18512, partial [Pristionchus entomophagus]
MSDDPAESAVHRLLRTARIEVLETSIRSFGLRDHTGAAIRALFKIIQKVNEEGLHEELGKDLDFLQVNIDHFKRNDPKK